MGRIMFNFAGLEMVSKVTLQAFIGAAAQEGYILTAGLSMETVLEVLESLCEHRFASSPDELAEWRRLLGKAREAKAKRNGIVHSVWALTADPDVILQIRMKPKAVGNWADAPQLRPADVNKVADEIAEVWASFTPFLARLTPPRSS